MNNAQAAALVLHFAAQDSGLSFNVNTYTAYDAAGRALTIDNNGTVRLFDTIANGEGLLHTTSASEMIGAAQAWGLAGIGGGVQGWTLVAQRGDWLGEAVRSESAGPVSKVTLGNATFYVEGSSIVTADRFEQATVVDALDGGLFDRQTVHSNGWVSFDEVDGQVGYSGLNMRITARSDGNVEVIDGVTEGFMGMFSDVEFMGLIDGLVSSGQIRLALEGVQSGLSIDKANTNAQALSFAPSADVILSSHKAEELPVYASAEDLAYVASKDAVVEIVGKSDFVEFVKFEG